MFVASPMVIARALSDSLSSNNAKTISIEKKLNRILKCREVLVLVLSPSPRTGPSTSCCTARAPPWRA
eukprot:9601358-Heterocapsa_arctica.AAC.1